MKPLVLPASTTNASLGAAVTIIAVWAAKQWGSLEVPDYVAQSFTAIVTVFLAHITTDSPSGAVAREAVDEAAADVETDAAKRKRK
jgi:hypothetical protein